MIQREIKPMGLDYVILVQGGKAHIGTSVVAVPYEKDGGWHVTLSTYNLTSHKDHIVAQQYAKALSLLTHHVTVCVCGIHFDAIQPETIDAILDWVKQDIEQMRKEFEHEQN